VVGESGNVLIRDDVLCQGACTHTGFLLESDPAPVVEFFTRTCITAAAGQFDFFERCTRKMFVHGNSKRNRVGFTQTEVFKTVVRHRPVQTRVQIPMQLH
jgi:hypothetical protein